MNKPVVGYSSTIKSEHRSERPSFGPNVTRRELLASTGAVALVAAVPFACAPTANKPFDDGTFWDDGSGWSA